MHFSIYLRALHQKESSMKRSCFYGKLSLLVFLLLGCLTHRLQADSPALATNETTPVDRFGWLVESNEEERRHRYLIPTILRTEKALEKERAGIRTG